MSKDRDAPALSDAELDEIEQRAARATQGPWRWGCWSTNFGSYEPAELTERDTLEYLPTMLQFSGGVRRAEDEPIRILVAERGEGPEFDDRVFIACAREDVPKLIAEVRRSRDALKALVAWRKADHELFIAKAAYMEASGGVASKLWLEVVRLKAVEEEKRTLAMAAADSLTQEGEKTDG